MMVLQSKGRGGCGLWSILLCKEKVQRLKSLNTGSHGIH